MVTVESNVTLVVEMVSGPEHVGDKSAASLLGATICPASVETGIACPEPVLSRDSETIDWSIEIPLFDSAGDLAVNIDGGGRTALVLAVEPLSDIDGRGAESGQSLLHRQQNFPVDN